jgi:hypothetical protein
MQTVIRRPDAEDAPFIRIPARRVRDFSQMICAIGKSRSHEQLIPQLLELLLKQFSASQAWVAMRKNPTGPMTAHSGRKRTTESIQLSDIALHETISRAIDRREYTLLPRLTLQTGPNLIRSAIIVPLLAGMDCHGVMYVANGTDQEHYSLAELDYLIFIGLAAAAMVRTF